jgi:hypothetical protein
MFKTGNGSCYKAIAVDVVTPAETFHGNCCNKINCSITVILKKEDCYCHNMEENKINLCPLKKVFIFL